MNLTNRTIIITGGTSGIGLALVNQLNVHNNKIIVVSKSAKKLQLFNERNNIYTFACNLASKEETLKCINDIVKQHPDISVLINNAAVQFTPYFSDPEFNIDSIDEEIQVNLTAPILLSAVLIKHWKNNHIQSAIINISSALALFPKTSSAVYCATKAALHNFSHALNYQLKNSVSQCHEVILPLVDTPMTRGRENKKISAISAAQQIIKGFQQQKFIIFVGKTKFLPLLARISPALVANLLKGS